MKIMPAPLEETAEGLRTQLTRLTPYFKAFQIDIADGVFVPNKTVQLEELKPVLAEFPDITVDFHLMVRDWEKECRRIETIEGAKIRYVLIHSKVEPPAEIFSRQISERFRLGLVINPEEEVEAIRMKYDLKSLLALQIMTVIPGKQGQAFIPEALNKIDQLRTSSYKSDIIIDGAVNDKTLPLILSRPYKPDYAGVGSFLTRAPDLKKAIATLDSMEEVTRV